MSLQGVELENARGLFGEATSEAMKEFSGNFKFSHRNDFGFTNDIFINAKLAHEHNLQEGQPIRGKAILSFNKKKGEWDWKALTLE